MPLTPADVHNVAFSKPPIGKRGYNEDEVDAFLDLVETELARLIEENADLRQRVSELDAEVVSGRSEGAQPTRTMPVYEAEPEREPSTPAVAEAVSPSITEEQAVKAARNSGLTDGDVRGQWRRATAQAMAVLQWAPAANADRSTSR